METKNRRRRSNGESPEVPRTAARPVEQPGAGATAASVLATDIPVSPSESAPEPKQSAETGTPATPKAKVLADYYDDFLTLISSENPLTRRPQLNEAITGILSSILAGHKTAEKYTVLIIFDNLTLLRQDTDKVYQAINALKDTSKPIALVVNSAGGSIEAGYLISKLCREFYPERFIAIVPRRAKSAATLICCGADEIHMGSMSELGPIDPQFEKMPALGLKNSVQHLAELAVEYPGASDMLAKYLSSSLKLIHLGYYERVSESAMQYAERLLKKRKVKSEKTPERIARTLVYGYKDHGFVIDRSEAEGIFGTEVIHANQPEYYMGNALYEALALIERFCETYGYHFYLYGTVGSAPTFQVKQS